MSLPDVAIVVSPRGWAERLHRFIADHGGARVRARVLDAREAVDHPYAVLVVEDLTSFLTARLVADVHERGRRILGVFDPAEPWGRRRLEELDVDGTLPADASPERFVQAIQGLATGIDLERELATLVDEQMHVAEEDETGRGTVTTVGGPSGGPGVTELAIATAVSLQERDGSTVLVDADGNAPSVAQRLGLRLHPNVRTAIDAVEHRTGTLDGSLQPLPRGGPAVLAGLVDRRDVPHLRPAELVSVLDGLAARHRHLVVDVGCRLDGPTGPGGGEPVGPAVLARADRIIGVGAPTPVGVARLLAWAAEVRVLAPATPISLVVNRAPRARFNRGELAVEIRRTVGVSVLAFVPADRRVEQAAWDGTTVGPGPFTRAVTGVVDGLAATASPVAGQEVRV